ncbi:MAG: hypothetical protein NC293_02390 [Roseburia sp.]|nr:hypothetical protein [Roseburia sp.]
MKRLVSIMLICVLVLSACGKQETEGEGEKDLQMKETVEPYQVKEMPLPDPLILDNSDGSDYIGNTFSGFVADLEEKPGIYYSNFSFEAEEYVATISRWSLDEEGNWLSEELCENSLSEFLNQKYEQLEWQRCKVENFRRGDNGSLYAVFTYYMKETKVVEGEDTDMIRQKYSILEIDEENDHIFEVPLEIGPAALNAIGYEWEPAVDWLGDYHIFEDGSIFILSTDSGGGYGYLVDGETGQVIDEVGNVVTGKRKFAFGESEIIFYSNEKKRFQVLSFPELEEQNTFGSELDDSVLGKEWSFYVNSDTWQVYLCNKSGLYRAAGYQNSDEVEWLTERTDMSEVEQADSEILDLFVGADEDFYICMMEATEEFGQVLKGYRIVHFFKE